MALVMHASTGRHAQYGGPKRYIRIVLHDTTDELRQAATRYRGYDPTGFAKASGCFQPAPDRERFVGDDWQMVSDPHWAGVMRLSRESLHTESVAHECVHAAAAIYRMDVKESINLGDGCGPREETLAYIIGDLTAAVNDALHAAEAW